MENKVNNIFIIAPLSIKENHFFLVNGLIPEDEISKLDSLVRNKEYIVIVTKENEIDWWAYFWNCQVEENKINTYIQSSYKGEEFNDNEIIFRQIFDIDETFFNLVKLNNCTILLKDVTLINYIINDISNKIEILWKNFDNYDNYIYKSLPEWYMTSLPLLNNLFYEKYKRVCYLILNDEQKEEEYNIINQSFRSEQNLLIVELDNEDKLSTILKFRIKVIRQINKHNYYFFEENTVEILNEFSVFIFANYANYEKKYDELFMIRAEDLKYLNKILNNIHEKYCYKWIDEDYFIATHKNKAFEEVPNSLWKEKNVFGIIIKEHDFHQKQSDFGSDNKFIVAFGDSKYPALRKLHPLEVWHYPRGFSSDSGKYFYDYYFFDTNMYTYFYQDKKLLLFNFDDVPYIDKVNRYYTGCIVDSIEKLSAIKVIRIPKFLLEDSFVLTTNWEENN